MYCLCRAMMMTACDLSAIAKPWEIQSKVRISVISTQGPFSYFTVVDVKWLSSLTHIQPFTVIRHRLQERLCEKGTNDKVDRE